jgi:hypothetical protein
VTLETDEDRIEQRSRNADATVNFLFEAYDWLWIFAAVLVGLGVLVFWLLG